MNTARIKLIVILLMLTGAAVVAWGSFFRVYHQPDTVSIHAFPRVIDGWVAQDLYVGEDEKKRLQTKNVFVRKYRSPLGEEVYLFVVYAENNRKVSHPPEICYAGSGVMVTERDLDRVALAGDPQGMRVNKLLLQKGPIQQVALYWFKAGDRFMASYWRQQTSTVWNILAGRSASSALIRVSATVLEGDQARAEALAKAFAARIVPELERHLP